MHIDPKLHSNCVCPFMFDVSSIAAMGFSGSDILFPGYYLLKMSSIYICSIACVLQCTADRYKAIIERNLFECKNSIVYERKKRNNNSKHMNEWNMLKIHIHVHNLIFILLINLMCSTKRVLRYCFFLSGNAHRMIILYASYMCMYIRSVSYSLFVLLSSTEYGQNTRRGIVIRSRMVQAFLLGTFVHAH